MWATAHTRLCTPEGRDLYADFAEDYLATQNDVTGDVIVASIIPASPSRDRLYTGEHDDECLVHHSKDQRLPYRKRNDIMLSSNPRRVMDGDSEYESDRDWHSPGVYTFSAMKTNPALIEALTRCTNILIS